VESLDHAVASHHIKIPGIKHFNEELVDKLLMVKGQLLLIVFFNMYFYSYNILNVVREVSVFLSGIVC